MKKYKIIVGEGDMSTWEDRQHLLDFLRNGVTVYLNGEPINSAAPSEYVRGQISILEQWQELTK